MPNNDFAINPIGIVRSPLKNRSDAPKQGYEGAPAAWIEIDPAVSAGLEGIAPGDVIILITWFHEARRDVLRLHPRDDETIPMTGVFDTRSPDRPNPLGLHRVRVLARGETALQVSPLEAIDGTPVIDIKPVLPESHDA
jgi:tRNA-Thr(GGU) m(6)t(6)A37 methyltransferase TsaA